MGRRSLGQAHRIGPNASRPTPRGRRTLVREMDERSTRDYESLREKKVSRSYNGGNSKQRIDYLKTWGRRQDTSDAFSSCPGHLKLRHFHVLNCPELTCPVEVSMTGRLPNTGRSVDVSIPSRGFVLL